MHSTVSYSQRKGGPRNAYKVYSCSAKLYDRTQKHATIQQSIVDEYFVPLVISDLYKRILEPPNASGLEAELQAVSTLLTANAEALDHLDNVLLDATMKRAHPKAKAQMLVLEAERTELLARRESMLAHTQDSGAIEAVLNEMRANTHQNGEGGLEGWATRLSQAWNNLPNTTKQAWIRSRYQATIKIGGRGPERIRIHHVVDTSTNDVDNRVAAQAPHQLS
jgi:hypothetical protein